MELGCCPHALSQTYSFCLVASQIHQVKRRIIALRIGKLAKLTILAFRFLDDVFELTLPERTRYFKSTFGHLDLRTTSFVRIHHSPSPPNGSES